MYVDVDVDVGSRKLRGMDFVVFEVTGVIEIVTIYLLNLYRKLLDLLCIIVLFSIMTTIFSSSSRLANFRQRKNSGSSQHNPNESTQQKLTLGNEDKTYEPTTTLNSTKTSLRLFKSKLDRLASKQTEQKQNQVSKPQFKSTATFDTDNGTNGTNNRISIHQEKSDMKLVLNYSPCNNQRKSLHEPEKKPQKRIMIIRDTPKNCKQSQQNKSSGQSLQQKQQSSQLQPEQTPKIQPQQPQQPQQPPQHSNPHNQKPIIRQEDIEQSKDAIQPQNENDLVICPEGCGRKFNRKALQKHAKACKLVFMSKRKQFNSQAKRLASKEQVIGVTKKNKQKAHILGKTKSKGFDKTSDNWKVASEDFRAVIKAIKKQDNDGQLRYDEAHLLDGETTQKQGNLNLVSCQYCEKMFANMLIQKHAQNCIKKKQKQRQLQKKKQSTIKRKQ